MKGRKVERKNGEEWRKEDKKRKMKGERNKNESYVK